MIKRLRIKFICINMLIVTVMLGIIFGMVLHFTGNSMEMESIRMMRTAGGLPGPPPESRNFLMTVRIGENGEILTVLGQDYDLSDEQLQEAVTAAMQSEKQVGVLKQYDLRFSRMRDHEGGKIIFADTSVERSMMMNLIRDCLIIGGISLVVFFFISLLLARWAIKPVEQAWQQQRQFVADASHELKTPLTVILTNAELLQSDRYDTRQKEKFTGSILAMSHQMRGLVENLLELARIDAGVVKGAKTKIDPQSAVSDAVMSFEALFFEKKLELECHVQEGLQILGNESRLRQLVEILLDNALKYSSPGTTRVSLVKQGHHALLRVQNPGEPISEADQKNIFKRFYRVDTVRSMNRSYGLGLAIAQGIVLDHGGRIKAESENGTNTFTVMLPLVG